MRAHDVNRRVRIVPNQLPGLRARVGLSKAQVDRAVWVVTREGKYYEAAAAINATWRVLPRWRWLARLYTLPLMPWIEARVYDWIATHRQYFRGVTPECERAGVACMPEGE